MRRLIGVQMHLLAQECIARSILFVSHDSVGAVLKLCVTRVDLVKVNWSRIDLLLPVVNVRLGVTSPMSVIAINRQVARYSWLLFFRTI